jgi:hypothetical protein
MIHQLQELTYNSDFLDGAPLEIIRNENIRDNEVAKEVGEEGEGKPGRKFNLVPIEWNFIPAEENPTPNTFALNNGFGCLRSNG